MLGLLAAPPAFPTTPSIFVLNNLLVEFDACSAAYVNTKQKSLATVANTAQKRPLGVALIGELYVACGALATFLTATTFGLSLAGSIQVLLDKALVFAGLLLLMAVSSCLLIIVAYGFTMAELGDGSLHS